jgi:YegS/Rv2252/BmrU family lipid kinase
VAARRILLVQNPGSGSAEPERVADLISGEGVELTRCRLEEVRDAGAADFERVIVAGGDGSLGPVAAVAAAADVAFAVVPAGTANDFARSLEIPPELEAACALARDGTSTRRIDLAAINGRPFLNAASLGLAPRAAHEAKSFKDRLGSLAYSLGAARAAATAEPLDCKVEAGAAVVHDGPAWQVTVASTGAFGGGSDVDADADDGALDAVVIEAGPRLRLVRHGYGFRLGNVEQQPGVLSARGARITITLGRPTDLNVDGELVRFDTTTLEFSIRPRAVELVVPG